MSSRAGGDWVRFIIQVFRALRCVGMRGEPTVRCWLGRFPDAITFIVFFPPKAFRTCKWFDLQVCQKFFLTPPPVQLSMVSAAKRHSKFIADLQAQAPTLGEADVMSIA